MCCMFHKSWKISNQPITDVKTTLSLFQLVLKNYYVRGDIVAISQDKLNLTKKYI